MVSKKIKNAVNGDIISITSKKESIDEKGIIKILKKGNLTIENSIYVRANAHEAKQSDMDLKKWIESHPHCWGYKDSDIPEKTKQKYKEEYGIE